MLGFTCIKSFKKCDVIFSWTLPLLQTVAPSRIRDPPHLERDLLYGRLLVRKRVLCSILANILELKLNSDFDMIKFRFIIWHKISFDCYCICVISNCRPKGEPRSG